MKIGVSGHRYRQGADWGWARDAVTDIFLQHQKAIGWSSLAVGADTLFAEIAIAYGRGHVAVLPGRQYGGTFDNDEHKRFTRLLRQSRSTIRIPGKTDEQTFKKAGELIVRKTDLMLFIWDGEPAQGAGGTGDIAAYAKTRNGDALWLDPIEKAIRPL